VTRSTLLTEFLVNLGGIEWLANAGAPDPSAVVVRDAAEGYDHWGESVQSTWLPRSKALESKAQQVFGDDGINRVFAAVSERLEPALRTSLQAYFDRRPDVTENTSCNADLGLWPEILDAIERDLAWAAVEHLLQESGFFTQLLVYYRAGRWPCGWQGTYPAGRAVVL
jgi:hypothetical protein